jgi:sensor histidine kinase YesM
VKMVDEEAHITVEDTGSGIDSRSNSPGAARAGVGLANVKRRLRLCYGPDADLVIESSPEGTKVQFAIPAAAALKP